MSNNKKDTSTGTKTTKKRVASSETSEKMPPRRAKPSAQTPVSHISGLITHRDTKKGITGLRIEAIDKDPNFDQPLGSGTTDAKGYYNISVPSRKIGKGETGGPDVVVRAFDQKGGLL
ncbi:MAG: hypothetical protein K2X64_08685, partial [Rhodocyclaceae bacterium]|nr:hypothetical protein [Rhodocyclaceae bacterium]